MGALKKTPWSKHITSQCTEMMNASFHSKHWPIITYYLFKEKLDPKTDGLTTSDFRDGFTVAYVNEYLKSMSLLSIPLIIRKEYTFEKTRYFLSPYAREVLGKMMWNSLVYLTKKFSQDKTSIQDYIDGVNRTRTLEPEPEAVDTEEELIKKIDEDNARLNKLREKSAGIVQTEEGPTIDLDKVQVTA